MLLNPKSLASIAHKPSYAFERADICDRGAVDRIFAQWGPDAVLYLAAESHVDRSIADAAAFKRGRYLQLLEAAMRYWASLEFPPPLNGLDLAVCVAFNADISDSCDSKSRGRERGRSPPLIAPPPGAPTKAHDPARPGQSVGHQSERGRPMGVGP
jgi:hypothetical protein